MNAKELPRSWQYQLPSSGTGIAEENGPVLAFIDSETTDKEGDYRPLEICVRMFPYRNVMASSLDDIDICRTVSEELHVFGNPGVESKPEASATHGISNRQRESFRPWDDDVRNELEWMLGVADAIVAHKVQFDIDALDHQFPGLIKPYHRAKLICTLRLAQHLWPGLPSYALQALRYRFDLVGDSLGSHGAKDDVALLIALFQKVVEESDTWNIKAIHDKCWSPIFIKTFMFGKHRGEDLAKVACNDSGYLKWFLGEETKKEGADRNDDMIYSIKKVLGWS